MEFTLQQIAHILSGTIQGDANLKVNNLAKIQDACPGSISFLSNPKYENFIYSTQATAVIVGKDFEAKQPISSTLIFVDDPYLSFTVLLEEYHRINSFRRIGIENPSYIGDKTTIGENVYRGAFSYIGFNCTIGNNVKIYPGVYIGDNVKIGNNTIFYAGVKVYSDSIIGNFCTFQAGAIVGSDGFGFAHQDDGSYKTIPQVGNVIIEDHVDIGANTVIDCATMGSTIIKEGVKLDNLIQIAHNVEIGKNTVIAAQTGISGSTKIGDNCIIAGQVGTVGHITLANNTTLGAKSGLSKSIVEEGKTFFGYPAFEHKAYLKTHAVFRKLPELLKRIEQLEEKVLPLLPLENPK